jgi:hypothetical protein
MIVNTKDKFSMLGIFNLDNARIQEQDWSNLNDIVTGANKPWICAKNCNE